MFFTVVTDNDSRIPLHPRTGEPADETSLRTTNGPEAFHRHLKKVCFTLKLYFYFFTNINLMWKSTEDINHYPQNNNRLTLAWLPTRNVLTPSIFEVHWLQIITTWLIIQRCIFTTKLINFLFVLILTRFALCFCFTLFLLMAREVSVVQVQTLFTSRWGRTIHCFLRKPLRMRSYEEKKEIVDNVQAIGKGHSSE